MALKLKNELSQNGVDFEINTFKDKIKHQTH